MPYAVVEDVAATWESYRQLAGELVERLPQGLVVHVAGPTDEGFRVIEVWETKEAFERSRREHPGTAAAIEALPARALVFRDLHPARVVFGTAKET
jgi:hypothetical protein